MNNYKVFRHPQNTIEIVKEGWSWPAFLFGCFWALFKKMWGLGIGLLAALFVSDFLLGNTLGEFWGWVIAGGMWMAFGFYGNEWRERHLLSGGCEFVGNVAASTPEAALKLYLKNGVSKDASPDNVPVIEEEPEIELVQKQPGGRVRIWCKSCGFDRLVDKSKFGGRTGIVDIKCPNCKKPVTAYLSKSTSF